MAEAKMLGLEVTPVTASSTILRANSPESSIAFEIWSDHMDTPAPARPWRLDVLINQG